MNYNEMNAYINAHRNEKFEWGVCDCCLFVGDYIKFMTDIDPAEKYRGHYSTELGSAKALKKYGSVESAIDEHFDRIEWIIAKRGSPVLFQYGDNKVLGIKWHGGILALTESDGVTVVKIKAEDVLCAWDLK